MARPTIADVAAAAHVSTATVDRVLNGRAGVSAASRQRVLRAARALQYLPSDGDTWLPARPVRLEFFIPLSLQGFLRQVADRIGEFAADLPLVSGFAVHDLPDLNPETLVAALGAVDVSTRGVGLVAVDHPATRLAVRDLAGAGVKVVTLCSDLRATPRSAYVGLDDRVAGRTAALVMGRMRGGRPGKIGLFAGQRALHGQRERETGFCELIEQEFPELSVLPAIDARNDNTLSAHHTRMLCRAHPDLIGIYCMGGGRSGVAQALADLDPARRPFVIMHDISETTRRALVDSVIDLVIDQNARLVAEQAVIRLLGAVASAGVYLPEHFIEPRLILRENIPV